MRDLGGLLREYPVLTRFLARLDGRLKAHLEGTAALAADLARRNGADPDAARLAGLLHDLLKPLPKGRLLGLMRRYRTPLDRDTLKAPSIWHGPAAAGLARAGLGIRDRAVPAAIRWHSTGRAGQGRLERALFVADFCAPDRDFREADRCRKLAFKDLDRAARYTVASKLAFLYDRGIRPHPAAYACWRGLVS